VRDTVRMLRRVMVITCCLFTLLFATVTFLPVLDFWVSVLSAPWTDEPRGTLIVLAGDGNVDHILGLSSYWRCVYAVIEWRRGGYSGIIFTGSAGIPESMRDFAVAQGIPSSVIRLETQSHSTHESAEFVASLLHGSAGPHILLTSDYHSRRAWLAFRKAGLEVTPRPFPDARKRSQALLNRGPIFIELMTESTKWLFYKYKHWI